MRHRLPHARGMGRRMLLLLLPLCAFGDGGTGKLIDGGIPAGALVHPIAAGGEHPPPPPPGWEKFIFFTRRPPPPPPRGAPPSGRPPPPPPAPPLAPRPLPRNRP